MWINYFKTFLLILLFVVIGWLIIPLLFASQSRSVEILSLSSIQQKENISIDEFALIYVGFSGCNEVCPITLSTISSFEPIINGLIPLLFIDLLGRGTETNQYAEQFNPLFTSINYENEAVLLVNELQVWWQSSQSQENQIQHSDRIYLIQRKRDQFFLINSYTGNSANLINHIQTTLSSS